MKGYLKKVLYSRLPHFFPSRRSIDSKDVGVTTLIGHAHVPMLTYTLSSFFYYLSTELPVTVIDDGTLMQRDLEYLQRFFNLTTIRYKDAETKMKRLLENYRHFSSYRFDRFNPFNKKKFDAYLLSPYLKTFFIECDILFFKLPTELKKWMTTDASHTLYMAHDRYHVKSDLREDLDYCLRRQLPSIGFDLATPSFNAGLLCINRSTFDLKLLNNIFKYFNSIYYSRCYTAEETAVAYLFNCIQSRKLNNKDYVCVARSNEYFVYDYSEIVAMHYISEAKHFIYGDSMKLALKTHLFSKSAHGL